MEIKDKIEELQKEVRDNGINILRQEKGILRIVQNIANHGFGEDNEKRIAVFQSLVVKLFWNSATIALIGGVGGLITIYFLYEQNQLIKNQNILFEKQNAALIRQFNVTVDAEYERLLLTRNTEQKNIALKRLIEVRRDDSESYVKINGYTQLDFLKNNFRKVSFHDIQVNNINGTEIDSCKLSDISSAGSYFIGTNIFNSSIDSSSLLFAQIGRVNFKKCEINSLELSTRNRQKATSLFNNSVYDLTFSDSKIEHLSITSKKFDVTIKDSQIGYLTLSSNQVDNISEGLIKIKNIRPIKDKGYIICLDQINIESSNSDKIQIIRSESDLKTLFNELESKYKERTNELELKSILEWDEAIKNVFEPYKRELLITQFY